MGATQATGLHVPLAPPPQNIDGSAMVIPVPILSLALFDNPLKDPALNAFHRFHAHGFHAFADEPLEFRSERDARMLLFKQQEQGIDLKLHEREGGGNCGDSFIVHEGPSQW